MNCLNLKNQNSVFLKKYQRQLFATFSALIIALSHGIGMGWTTSMIYKLQSKDSPLIFRISIEDTSWIGSLTNVGGVAGTILSGFFIDRVGRKICLYIIPIPHIFFWIMVFFAQNVYHLYLGRFIFGITGGGTWLIFPIFISEISDPQIRGTLGSLSILFTNTGVLVGNIVVSHVPYYIIPPVVLTLPIISLLLIAFCPETPQHLLRKGKFDKAKSSLEFYTNHKSKNKEDEQKIYNKFVELKTAIDLANSQKKVTLHDFNNKRSLKGMAIGVTIVFINVFCGFYSVTNYSPIIFAETKSSINPNTNTIFIGVVMVLGSYVASFLVDIFGRKILLFTSAASMIIGYATIGAYAYLADRMDLASFHLVPVVVISFIIFTGSTGIAAITFVVLVEVLPPKIRSLGATICITVLGVFSFTAFKIFPILLANIGLSGVMWIFAGVSSFGFLFFLFFIEETKGKSLDDDEAFD